MKTQRKMKRNTITERLGKIEFSIPRHVYDIKLALLHLYHCQVENDVQFLLL